MDTIKLVRIYGSFGSQLLVDLTKVVNITLDKKRMWFHYNEKSQISHMFSTEEDAANELEDILKHLEKYYNKNQ